MIITHCAEKNSGLYRIDPRVKVVAIFGFIALVSTLTSRPLLLAAAGIVAGVSLLSGIGAGALIRRIALVLPFAGVVLAVLPFTVPGEAVFVLNFGPVTVDASAQGVSRAAVLSLRVLTAVLAVNILTSTTGFGDLMKALRGLKTPEIFVQLLEFAVRYIFVLADEVRRMRLARKSRCFNAGGTLLNMAAMRTLGQLVGVLFVRSWDRGERIYCAMLSRGYSSVGLRSGSPGIKLADLCWGVGILAAAAGLRLFESGYYLQ